MAVTCLWKEISPSHLTAHHNGYELEIVCDTATGRWDISAVGRENERTWEQGAPTRNGAKTKAIKLSENPLLDPTPRQADRHEPTFHRLPAHPTNGHVDGEALAARRTLRLPQTAIADAMVKAGAVELVKHPEPVPDAPSKKVKAKRKKAQFKPATPSPEAKPVRRSHRRKPQINGTVEFMIAGTVKVINGKGDQVRKMVARIIAETRLQGEVDFVVDLKEAVKIV